MAKKKNGFTKAELRQDAKYVKKVLDAWVAAGEPQEGITVDGVHHTPLDFGPEWRKQCEERAAAKAGSRR